MGSEIKYEEMLRYNNIILSGRGYTGKTTLAKQLEKDGYFAIHVDELIRKNWDVFPVGIYANNEILTEDQLTLLKLIKNVLNEDAIKPKIVIEGLLRSCLISEIQKMRKFEVHIRVQHENWKSLYYALQNRALSDIKNDQDTLGYIWKEPEAELVRKKCLENTKDCFGLFVVFFTNFAIYEFEKNKEAIRNYDYLYLTCISK